MNVRRIVMDIQSDKFEENRNFYENLIGLKPGMDLGWIMTLGSPSAPAAQLTVLKKDLTASVNPNLTIEVEDVDGIYADAVKQGLNIIHPLTDEPWGVRRFFVMDPNGLIVNIMSHIPGPSHREKMKTSELLTLPFKNKQKWASWLAREHAKSPGVWLKLAKKDSGIPSVTYDEALDVALCYGWIDGQKKSFDDQFWLQKFTRRGPRSIWSKINTEKAEKLIASGEMKPAGLKAIEAARQDGRWDAAYASQKNIAIPEDFQSALDQNTKAKAFFAALKSSERYSFLFRIHHAKKPETRAKYIRRFVEMLEKGEKLH